MSKIKFGTKLRLTASTKVYRDPEKNQSIFKDTKCFFGKIIKIWKLLENPS